MATTKPGRLTERLGLSRRGHRDPEDAAGGAVPRLEDFVVITGYSGAGKSTAMEVFEDAGYFCVDNLPPEMIGGLVELFLHEGSKVQKAAVVSDARGGACFPEMADVLDELVAEGVEHRVLFLTADEQTLQTRYKETRRRHPLSPEGSVQQGIELERERVGHLADFYERLLPLLDYLIPQYVSEGKAHLTIAIGCTGGRHRSVAISEFLAKRFRAHDDIVVDLVHRDADR